MSDMSPYQAPASSTIPPAPTNEPLPTWVTVVCIFGMTMGGIGLLCGACGLAVGFMQEAMLDFVANNTPQQPGAPDMKEVMERTQEATRGLMPFQYASGFLSILACGMVLWFSITTFKLSQSGRGMLAMSFFGLAVINVLGLIVTCITQYKVGIALADLPGQVSPWINIALSIGFSLPFAIAYVVSGIYLNSGSVKNWYDHNGH